jgi:hypothetical protein
MTFAYNHGMPMLVSALMPDEPQNQNTAASITFSFDLRAAT